MQSHTVFNLCLISFALSILTFFISKKHNKFYTELLAIPILGLASALFSETEEHDIRIQIITILILSYVASYLLVHGIAYIYKLIKLQGNNPNTDKQLQVTINLPVNNKYVVDAKFVDDLPANVDSLVHVSENLHLLTENFISSFSQKTTDSERATELRSYFLGICYHLVSLFDSSTRVHVRILKDGSYQKYVATCASVSGGEYLKNMKVMSFDNKMIRESFSQKCSIIKSLNPSLHEEGSNRKWKNYLMFALPQITHDGHPVFTFGISITKKRNDTFYFLNYCEIESIVGHFIEKIMDDNTCHLKEFIENYYFPSS